MEHKMTNNNTIYTALYMFHGLIVAQHVNVLALWREASIPTDMFLMKLVST